MRALRGLGGALVAVAMGFAAVAQERNPPGTVEVAVRPFGRYEASLEAETHGYHTTKTYPYLSEIVRAGGQWARGNVGCAVPYYTVVCYGADGKAIHGPTYFEDNCVLIREKRCRYRTEFRAPPGAVKAVLAWKCPDKRDTLTVENAAIVEVKGAKTLNINPEFANGPNDWSGWSLGSNNDILPDPLNPGKYMMVCGNRFHGGSTWTGWIPVEPGKRYRLEYNFQQTPDLTDGRSRVLFMTYADARKSSGGWTGTLKKELAGGKTPKDGSYSFVVPEGIHCIRSLIENTVVRRYALSEEVAK